MYVGIYLCMYACICKHYMMHYAVSMLFIIHVSHHVIYLSHVTCIFECLHMYACTTQRAIMYVNVFLCNVLLCMICAYIFVHICVCHES